MKFYLKVSNIIVNSTNFPSNGTTNDVGGMISANRRKNTVSDSKMDIDRLTWKQKFGNRQQFISSWVKKYHKRVNMLIYVNPVDTYVDLHLVSEGM